MRHTLTGHAFDVACALSQAHILMLACIVLMGVIEDKKSVEDNLCGYVMKNSILRLVRGVFKAYYRQEDRL